MVARAETTGYTVEEAADLLNRAVSFVNVAIARGELVPDADGHLPRASLLAFAEEEARRAAALREIIAVSEESGLYAPETYDRLVELGIVDPEEDGDSAG